MDNMAYLEQIAVSKKPAAPKQSFIHSKKFLIILGVIVFFALFLLIISSLLNSNSNKEPDAIAHLNLRTTNLLATLKEYNPSVKSSTLRSLGSSLSAQLTDLNRDVAPVAKELFNKKIPEKITEEETSFIDNLNSTLETARLNGVLDRVFVREFTLQIVLVNTLQSEILARTKDENLANALNGSIPNLKELHTQFEDYSEL